MTCIIQSIFNEYACNFASHVYFGANKNINWTGIKFVVLVDAGSY